MKKDAHFHKKTGYTRIALFTVVILMSSLIMYGDVLPKEINELKNIEFPVITGVLICAVAVFSLMITCTKIGQDFTQLSSNQQNPIDSHRHISKVSESLRVILINGAIHYTFIRSRPDKQMG